MKTLDERIACAEEKLIKVKAKYDHLVYLKNKGGISKRILNLKRKHKYTYDDIAAGLGVSRQRAEQICKKDELSLSTINRVAKFFDVTVDYFISGGTDDEDKT